jgi:L-alanine-DL-glutamate epimerase-like enolase superfamily enzyme
MRVAPYGTEPTGQNGRVKITAIRSMRLRGPLVHGQGGEVGSTIGKVLVRVDTDAGIYGLGEADDFMGVGEAIAYMREYFRGRDPFDANAIISEFLWASLPPHPANARHGEMAGGIIAVPSSSPTAIPFGPVTWAASAVDIALVDLIGKALGVPAYTLLGGKFRDRIRIYLDRSSPADVGDLGAWRTMAQDAVDQGFTQAKFDIDYVAMDRQLDVWNRSLSTAQINRMVERLGLVREVVGPDFELCVDLHRQFNVPDAIRVAHALGPLNLLWLEDPTSDTDLDAYLAVKAASPIALCVGEMFIAEQFRLFVDHGAIDVLHPDVLFCGGMHEMRRIADYADLHRLPLAMHGNGGALATIAAAQVAAASRNFLGLEYHFIETPWISQYARRVGAAAGAPLFEDGHVVLTDAPGLGIELDEQVCRTVLGRGESLFD